MTIVEFYCKAKIKLRILQKHQVLPKQESMCNVLLPELKTWQGAFFYLKDQILMTFSICAAVTNLAPAFVPMYVNSFISLLDKILI